MSIASRVEPWARRVVPRRWHGDVLRLMAATADVARRVWSNVPGDSTRFGAPRGLCLTPDANVEEIRIEAAREQRFDGWQRLGPEGAHHERFVSEAVEAVPPVSLYRFRDSRVFGPSGIVIDHADRVAGFVSSELARGPRRLSVFTRLRLPPVVDEPGTVAVLASDGAHNYWHFMVDVLPRLGLLRRAGILADKYFVPARSRFQVEALELLGVPIERVVDPSKTPHLRSPQMIAASLNLDTLAATRIDFLRGELMPVALRAIPTAERPTPRRLYISRSGAAARRVHGEERLVSALADMGFVAVHPEALSLVEQIRLFHGAEAVIGPHGAGLTNIAFCRPGTVVIELFHPGYVNTVYGRLATLCGLRYGYFLGHGQAPRSGRRTSTRLDIDLDAAAFMRAVRSMIHSPDEGSA